MIDVDVPLSPGWWLQRCSDKLRSRMGRLKGLFDRYEGEPFEPDWLETAPDAAKRFYRSSRTSFAEMIVKAPLRRFKVTSIMTSADQSETGDAEAWKRWKKAGMLVNSTDLVRTMLIAGDAYAIVGVDDDGEVYATAEDPRQVVTVHDPIRQEKVRAGAKFFDDPDTRESFAFLYMPGRRYVAKYSGMTGGAGLVPSGRTSFNAREWVWDEDRGGADGEAWPAGMERFVGVVRFRNDEGVGEFERHEDILNRIDHVILQAMVVATMQAFKQRAIKVDPLDMPDHDPETGELIDYNDIFEADPGALWKLPATAELWESGQVDLTGILQMAEKELQRLSAVTFTPLSMFNSDAVNQSASGAELVREGLTDKVSALHDRCQQPFAMVASAVLTLSGLKERADLDDIKIGYAPPLRYSLYEKAQAGGSGEQSGIPWRTRMAEIWQFTPEQIERMETERFADALMFPQQVAAAPAARQEVAQEPVDEVVDVTGEGDAGAGES